MGTQNERSGRCLCGAVSYSLNGPIQITAICHCKHCQRQSGSAFSIIVGVLTPDYQQSGETSVFHDTGDSGGAVERHFCAKCGSPILSKVTSLPDLLFIKAGTLDNTTDIQPEIEAFCDSAMTCLPDFKGTEKHRKSNI